MTIEDVRERVLAQKDAGQIPKLHPHGFIQLDLCPGDAARAVRFHVWDDDIPRTADPFTLHDHVWSFRSEVLRGTLVNETYPYVYWNEAGNWVLWSATEARHAGARGGKVLEPSDIRATLPPVVREQHEAGASYEFPAFVFHDSVARGLTATLFEKTATYEGAPRILCKEGRSPDGETPAEANPGWMWGKLVEAVS